MIPRSCSNLHGFLFQLYKEENITEKRNNVNYDDYVLAGVSIGIILDSVFKDNV